MNIFKLTNVPAALFILFCSNVNAQFYKLHKTEKQNSYTTVQNYQKKNWTRLKTPVLIHSQHIPYME